MVHDNRRLVKVVGLQRSGTNWLERLLANNYGVRITAKGKHRLPHEGPHFPERWQACDAVIVIRKRVDHWMDSTQRTFGYLRSQRPELFDGDTATDRAAQFHKRYYDEWHGQPGVYSVEYEDLLRNPEKELTAIAEHFGFRRVGVEWNLNGPNWSGKRDYYLDRN
jgi:hypothetical protein